MQTADIIEGCCRGQTVKRRPAFSHPSYDTDPSPKTVILMGLHTQQVKLARLLEADIAVDRSMFHICAFRMRGRRQEELV